MSVPDGTVRVRSLSDFERIFGMPPKDPDETVTVVWVGHLYVVAALGIALGLMVGLALGVLLS